MRNLIWRMTAAVVGTVALVSAAAAQAPAAPAPRVQTAPPAAVQPATPAPAHVHPAPAPVVVGPAPVVVAPAPAVVGGCGTPGCGTGCSGTSDCCPDGGRGKKHKHGIGAGTASPVGCGCCASEKTFLFGSCKQFFSPGKTCDGGHTGIKGCGGHCGGLFGGHGRRSDCGHIHYATPYGKPADSCWGPFSYLDR